MMGGEMGRTVAHKLAWIRMLLIVVPAIGVTGVWLARAGPRFDVAYVRADGTGYRVVGLATELRVGVSKRSWLPGAGSFYTARDPEPPPAGTVYIDGSGGATTWTTGNEVRRGYQLFDVIPYPSLEDYSPTTGAQRLTETALSIPYWQVAMAMLVPAGVVVARRAVRGWRARRAARNNLCPVCAYDLRASADRCPECGTRISPKTTEAMKTATAMESSAGRAGAK
jgi:hypothetical protein